MSSNKTHVKNLSVSINSVITSSSSALSMKTISNILPVLQYHLHRSRAEKTMAKGVMPKHPSRVRQKKNLSTRKKVSVKELMIEAAIIRMRMGMSNDRISKD